MTVVYILLGAALLYAAAISALLASVFSALWWSLTWKLVSFSALVWIGGLTVFLTAPGLLAAKVFLICGALEVFVVFFLLYRRAQSALKRMYGEHNPNAGVCQARSEPRPAGSRGSGGELARDRRT